MTRPVAALLLVLALAAPALLSAKGATVRISLTSRGLQTPIEIRQPTVLERFNVWSGPGTASSLRDPATGEWARTEGDDGFIVDWRAGEVAGVPEQLERYETSFFVAGANRTDEQLAYVVIYAPARQSGEGYVFLPGPGDAHFTLNTRSILRGREGKWYRASAAWQAVVAPLLAARAAH